MSAVDELERADYERREAAWARKAEFKGWICSVCGDTPLLGETETFFETGMCGYCDHSYYRFMKED